MHHDPGVRQRVPLAGRARGEEELAHRCRQPEAHRGDVAADELHRVVDRHPGRDRSAGAVDVQPDVGVEILALEEQQLGADLVGDVVVDVGAEHDDAVLEQAVEHVHARVETALESHWAREVRHGEWLLDVRHARRLPGGRDSTSRSARVERSGALSTSHAGEDHGDPFVVVDLVADRQQPGEARAAGGADVDAVDDASSWARTIRSSDATTGEPPQSRIASNTPIQS